MNLPVTFTEAHRQLLPLPPPADLGDLRRRMKRAVTLARAYIELNPQDKTLRVLVAQLTDELKRTAWSEDPTTAACERAIFLMHAAEWCSKHVGTKSTAASVYGSEMQHELIALALQEDEVWTAFQDGAWFALEGQPSESYLRGALRAARTAASLMHQGLDVYLPTIKEDVYNCIDLFAFLEQDGGLRCWAIQVKGGREERIRHLESPPSRVERDACRLWEACEHDFANHGFAPIPTFVFVPDVAPKANDAA